MKKNNLVSIVIPCYNQAEYLEEAVQSAIAQTYADIEIIIVNDGSTDDTQEIAEKLVKKHPNKINLLRQENQGLSAARNHGIKNASGKYIVPLDADDKLHETMVEKCIHTIEDNNADIVYPGYQGFGTSYRSNLWQSFEQTYPLYATPCSALALMKKKVWEVNGGYKINMMHGYEDWEFWVNAYKHNMKFVHIAEKLFFYRIKKESMYTDAYKKDAYLKAEIIMNHPELYTAKQVQESMKIINETENLADIYFYTPENYPKIDTEVIDAINNYLSTNTISDIHNFTIAEGNIELYALDDIENIKMLKKILKNSHPKKILFYAPMRYEAAELINCDFAWKSGEMIKTKGSLFSYVFKEEREHIESQLIAHKRLEKYHEYLKTKFDNLQHKYNMDTNTAEKKYDSLQHKYFMDINTVEKKFNSLQHKYNMDTKTAETKFNSLQHKYSMEMDAVEKKFNTTENKLKNTVKQLTIANKKNKEFNSLATSLKKEIVLIKESLSYRLGHTLIHEKATLFNPLRIFRKIKTLYKIMDEKRIQQQTIKTTPVPDNVPLNEIVSKTDPATSSQESSQTQLNNNTLEHKTVIPDEIVSKTDSATSSQERSSTQLNNNTLEHKTVTVDEKIQDKTLVSESNTAQKDGITVIMVTYKGEKTIKRALDSLALQDINKKLLEIIIVINGEKDNSENIIKNFIHENPELLVRLFISDEKGASPARNKAIKEASKKYICMLDDDDAFSPTYLSSMYKVADEETMVLPQIINISKDGIDASTPMNLQVLKTDLSVDNPYYRCPSILTITGAKLVPSKYMKQVKVDPSLANGEDVAYFSELISRFSFKYIIEKEAIYFRFVPEISQSRQPLSFQFNVVDRLKVIALVFSSLKNTSKEDIQYFLEQKIYAQTNIINKYLQEYPNHYEKVVNEIIRYDLLEFPFYRLQKNGTANELVISYCFTPYVDTSAIVMAKRIREQGKLVDIAYNNMDKHREKDNKLHALADDLIGNRIAIDSPTGFNNWEAVESFSNQTFQKLTKLKKPPYTSIYSRVMWPASNFVAFKYKLDNPTTTWISEFSDPITYDVQGNLRYAKIEGDWYYKEIEELLRKRDLKMPENDNLFFWCEYLAYVFADELIFTNKNQLSYMLEKTEKEIQEIVIKKATIERQPTLPEKYYQIKQSDYAINTDKINLAYFGAFYQTRKLNDLVEIVKILPQSYKEKVVIHVFTNTKEELSTLIEKEKLSENFRINDYVNYFEFLNLTTKFDCLVLNDAITKPEKNVNPYLPSKLSDYKGSQTDIWVLFEEDSIISACKDIKYKSELGNINEGCKVIEKIIEDHQQVVLNCVS